MSQTDEYETIDDSEEKSDDHLVIAPTTGTILFQTFTIYGLILQYINLKKKLNCLLRLYKEMCF